MAYDRRGLCHSGRNLSAYLEYASIASHLPRLLNDIEPPAMASMLTQAHLNIWLGNGRTVGKLHFDPFDNLLVKSADGTAATRREPCPRRPQFRLTRAVAARHGCPHPHSAK